MVGVRHHDDRAVGAGDRGPGGIRDDGWRLRSGAGYWQYSDRPMKWVPGVGETRVALKRNGSFADLLLGYHKSLGPLTVKAYGGIAYATSSWLQDGADDGSPGSDFAAKVLVESWLNLTPVSFAQLDAGWTSLRDTITARARLGYRITPSLSLGPEAGYWSNIDAESNTGVTAWRYGGVRPLRVGRAARSRSPPALPTKHTQLIFTPPPTRSCGSDASEVATGKTRAPIDASALPSFNRDRTTVPLSPRSQFRVDPVTLYAKGLMARWSASGRCRCCFSAVG